MHRLKKLFNTLRICGTLFMARTFGEYQHTVWANGLQYARYTWRGRDWPFPTGPIELEFEQQEQSAC